MAVPKAAGQCREQPSCAGCLLSSPSPSPASVSLPGRRRLGVTFAGREFPVRTNTGRSELPHASRTLAARL